MQRIRGAVSGKARLGKSLPWHTMQHSRAVSDSGFAGTAEVELAQATAADPTNVATVPAFVDFIPPPPARTVPKFK